MSPWGSWGGEAAAREKLSYKNQRVLSPRPHPPYHTPRDLVIPQPGFLRDAGSREGKVNIQNEAFLEQNNSLGFDQSSHIN